MDNKLFKTVLSGYEKKAVEERINYLEDTIERLKRDSEMKIKQAQMVAQSSGEKAEQAMEEKAMLSLKVERLQNKAKEDEETIKQILHANEELKEQLKRQQEEWNASMEREQKRYEEEIQRIQEQEQREIARVEEEYQRSMENQQKEHEEMLERMEREFEERERQSQEEIEAAAKERELEAQRKIESCDAEIKQAKEKAAQEEEDARTTKQYYEMKVKQLESITKALANVSEQLKEAMTVFQES